ncbi:unnamed protein product [Clonostachys chloroleuca]|uniref:Uncharacterized protein n=1 Tax=Clonostachys chloroleuca TaxID=1926264 RepID=A0AA35MBQ8_9HYPO|nr:unnamed protein product [Clonostachys chloroleuca]
MGAQQSSSQGSGNDAAAPTQKTCYYELLAIDKHATDEEIKKAYRRKALELHPDRNLDNVAVATQKFAEVQSAYEVLSDPQERAWYDSHRDAILRGEDGGDGGDGGADQPSTFRNVRLTSTEEILSLMRRFNTTIPFNDEPTGFYGIARETFEHLVLEEQAAADFDDVDCPDYPTFGQSDDDYDTVVRTFYSSWANFSTRKSFSWKDKYRLSDAPDRRVRRLMEKENKKLREDAAREFNDAVRFLVTFVRKRDPRYLPNSQTESDRQKAMRDAAAAQAARSRAANQEKLASAQVSDWVTARENEVEEDHFEESEEEEEEESEVEVLECVVCNKEFKSVNQLEAHERSKKHTKAVQQLRRQMRKEGAELELDSTTKSKSHSKEEAKSKSKSNSKNNLDSGSESEADAPQASSPSPPSITPQEHLVAEVIKKNESQIPEQDADTPSSDDGDYAPRSAVQDRLFESNLNIIVDENDQELAAALDETSINETTAPEKKKGKAKMKREKKAAREAETTDTNRCGVCAETFPSRTKLFQHINDEGHATPVPLSSKKRTKGMKKR